MTRKLRADILLIIITVVWGASFPLMKIMLGYMPAFAYLAFRFILAALALALIFGRNISRLNRKTLLYGLIIGTFMFAGMAFQIFGLYVTSASNSGFITGLNVVIVPIISAVMLKKRPDRSSAIGVLIAFAGLFFLSGGLSFSFNSGDLLTFFCSICWAIQIILIDRFTAEVDPPLLAIIQLGTTGILSLIFWMATGVGTISFNKTSVSILLFTAVLGSALAFGGQTIAQKDTTPTHTALIFTAEPVFAAIFAMLIPYAYGQTETLGLASALGCVLILAGMLVSEFGNGKSTQAADSIGKAEADYVGTAAGSAGNQAPGECTGE